MPGNVAISVEAGLYLGAGLGFDLTAGGEFILTKFRPGDLFALDLGAGARGLASFYRSIGGTYGYTAFGASPFLALHMGFRGFDFEFAEYLEPLDVFTALGLGYMGYSTRGTWTDSEPGGGLAFHSFNGFNYFITDRIAVSLVYSYWANWNYINLNTVSIGARLRLGPKEELVARRRTVLDEIPETMDAMTGNLAYAQFSAYYWLVLGYGGFIADDESFGEGDGVRWLMRYPDEDDVDELAYTRSLLRINSDGSKWWRIEFEVDDETAQYEYLVDLAGAIQVLRYEDPETGEVIAHEPRDPDAWWGGSRTTIRDREDLEAMSEGTERVRVPAGAYRAERVTAQEDDYEYNWWYTDEVPGLLVKLVGYEDDTVVVEGELQEVLSGVTTPWEEPW